MNAKLLCNRTLASSVHYILGLDRRLYTRHPLSIYSTELLLIIRYLMSKVLGEPLHVLRSKGVHGTSLACKHAHHEELLGERHGDILTELLGYLIEIHIPIIGALAQLSKASYLHDKLTPRMASSYILLKCNLLPLSRYMRLSASVTCATWK